VSRELPVRVTGVEVQDPVIVLFGDGWSLSVACPWRGVVAELPITWLDDDIEDRIWDVVGEDLISVQNEGRDVRFVFTRSVIVATPDVDLDPWVLALPGNVVVGSVL
jgi:hypothetical protein